MTRNGVAAKVAERKQKYPEQYCPEPKCLWRTGGGYCPRHWKTEALARCADLRESLRQAEGAD